MNSRKISLRDTPMREYAGGGGVRKAWGMIWSLDILYDGEREERLEREATIYGLPSLTQIPLFEYQLF